MGCSDCKKKQNIKEEIVKSTDHVQKYVVGFVIVWSVFAIYGIYSAIKNFL